MEVILLRSNIYAYFCNKGFEMQTLFILRKYKVVYSFYKYFDNSERLS